MDLYFVLVEPAVPENVGAAARAMKTMGFSHLRIVNGCDRFDIRAQRMAHASTEILERAEIFSTLAAALSDIDLSIAATARRRRVREDYHPADQLPAFLASKGKSIERTALVFGREDRGLHNEEIDQCDAVTCINLSRKQPSLNLAQAVMLYAYELSGFGFVCSGTKPRRSATEASFGALKKSAKGILDMLDLPDTVRRRLGERIAMLTDIDVQLLHSVVRELKRVNPSLRDPA